MEMNKSEWNVRTTILARKKKRICVKTFREPFRDGWITTFKKVEEPDIITSPQLSSREKAKKLHEEAIHDAETCGYTVISDSDEAKEIACTARDAVQAAPLEIYVDYTSNVANQGGYVNDEL